MMLLRSLAGLGRVMLFWGALVAVAEEANTELLPVVPGSLGTFWLMYRQLEVTRRQSVRDSTRCLPVLRGHLVDFLLLVRKPPLVLLHEKQVLLKLNLVLLHQLRSLLCLQLQQLVVVVR